ncbi:conserved hypothetical signal peptide protein [Methylocella silvestris BL2]|uniref:Conserved hypothetical signal peptide protein n=1 Tax=Methylocella silvestris (strain DSM 15510 / CIP 108128 / LMG 27833 / NCIMB 13906 / BL2) TaxID=395965 RepID=B8EQ60_METSB|nr:hypothetical protein [Methylocella silvestris]ACK51550.1 conserved hypothetical signal peptide protein [Methylocella silvestris BL2]
MEHIFETGGENALASVLGRLRRRFGAEAARRKALLLDCVALFDEAEIGVGPDGWAALRGVVGGRAISVSLMSESIAWRRLPQLWLTVTLACDLPVGGVLDIVRRSANVEFYSPAADLPLRLSVPPQWPQDTLIKGRGDGAAQTLSRLAEPLAGLLSDPRVKEMLVTPRGARLVYRLREGARGAYLLLRQSRFDLERLAPEELSALIRSLAQIVDCLLVLPAPERIAEAHAL